MDLNKISEAKSALSTYGGPANTKAEIKYTYYDSQMRDKDQMNVEKISVLIKALGTMVVEPQYETSETFQKVQIGSVQKPIIEGAKRDEALNKLAQLINKL